ncbi:cardiolipin synthase [Andreprevotia chitinilytica]|uniref:cardiolipin synthase n=1 Tax=Andreprevotia chitinilytica TaxID=396808 RepID=UPI0009FFCFD9|nr:cardiolipin synthase [Andreprevotia chitinilytica]
MESTHPPLHARHWPALRFFCLAGLLGLLLGCSSLPTIVPDLDRDAGPPVQLEGTHGPLSAAQSKAILDRLSSSGQTTDIFARHLALEEAIVGSPLTTDNRVLLLQNGPATYQAMFAAITAAQDHINIETYLLDDDEIGQRFAQALIDKQRQGVQVNLIRDSVGTLNTPTAFFKRMADSGIKVLEFNPVNPLVSRKVWALNQRDHRKLLIVDGRIAFLGGINISGVYSGSSLTRAAHPRIDGTTPAWRDTDLQLQGPVVAELQKLFLAAWENQKGEPLAAKNYFPPPEHAGRQVVRAIGSSPDEPYSLIYATLLSAIGSAETSVHLTNAYFAPDPQLLAALKAAARRGVEVTLILPSQTDSWLIFHTGHGYYEQLLRTGVKIYERRGVILHSKTALIDGVWATVGSTNLDWRSFLHNHELNAVVLGAEFGSQLQVMFDNDIAESDAITLEHWLHRPLNQHLKETFARIWEYWL